MKFVKLTKQEHDKRDAERIANILEALREPKTLIELGQAVGFHRINKNVADLRAKGLIRTNPLTKKMELCGWTSILVEQ